MTSSWTTRNRAAIGSREYELLTALRTTSILNKSKWIELARLYKKRAATGLGDQSVVSFHRAEIAYVGALYCDLTDGDVTREWLAVYTMNKVGEMDPRVALQEAQRVTAGMADVVANPVRLLEELQHLLFFIEREEVVGAAPDDVGRVHAG